MGSENGIVDHDAVWRTLKPWGKFQLFQMSLIFLDFIPASFAILSAVFTGFIPEYFCEVPSDENNTLHSKNVSYSVHQCHYDVTNLKTNETYSKTCHRFSFANENSYSYEWNLVCSRANLAALAQSLVLAGQGIGALIMSHFSDRYGRKTIHVLSHVLVFCCMVVMAFSKNIHMMLVIRLITGIFQQGIVCTGFTLVLEMLPKENRSYTAPTIFIAWSSGLMVLSLYGYLFRDINWRYLQIALAAFSLYSLGLWWLLDESVRWLLTNGKLDEAKTILKKAARWNKVDYKQIESVLIESIQLTDNKSDECVMNQEEIEMKAPSNNEPTDNTLKMNTHIQAVKRYKVIDILKTSSLRRSTFILWYMWIVGTSTYFGLTLVASHLAGDRFLNFFLSGLSEIPPQFIGFFLFNRIGRKRTMIIWFSLSGFSLVIATGLLTIYDDKNGAMIIATGFSLIGKSAITGLFSAVFLYTPEIYPTNYRNSGLGIASSVSRIGAIFAPFVSNLVLVALWLPGAILGGMCLMAVILAICLPESTCHELPTTIEEYESWESNNVLKHKSEVS